MAMMPDLLSLPPREGLSPVRAEQRWKGAAPERDRQRAAYGAGNRAAPINTDISPVAWTARSMEAADLVVVRLKAVARTPTCRLSPPGTGTPAAECVFEFEWKAAPGEGLNKTGTTPVDEHLDLNSMRAHKAEPSRPLGFGQEQ